jgi:hypothetical protein
METSPIIASFEQSVVTIASGAHDDVSEYYGKVLSNSKDLQTSACTTSGRPAGIYLDCYYYLKFILSVYFFFSNSLIRLCNRSAEVLIRTS